MIRTLTAHTLEADDKGYALAEILQQLNLTETQMKHTAGLMICHPDFIDTGVAQEIAGKLPFDVIGCTSLSSMTPESDEALMLSLCVYTSDDIEFSLMNAEVEQSGAIQKAYGQACAGRQGAPALIVPFVPLVVTMGAEEILFELDAACAGAPVFGTVALDHTLDLSRRYTVENSQASRTAMPALLFWGDLDPVFCVSQMSEKYVQKHRSVITKSEGIVLKEVNDLPISEYLETIGIEQGEDFIGLGDAPFLIDYGDGTMPVARGILSKTEEGHAVCGGIMPENSLLAIGSVERDDVMDMTQRTMRAALATGKRQGLIMFPCASHFWVIGSDGQPQKDLIKQAVSNDVPYLLGYAGGEICPVFDDKGHMHNRFHCYTFIACIF